MGSSLPSLPGVLTIFLLDKFRQYGSYLPFVKGEQKHFKTLALTDCMYATYQFRHNFHSNTVAARWEIDRELYENILMFPK